MHRSGLTACTRALVVIFARAHIFASSIIGLCLASLAMDPAAFLGPAARRKALLSKALVDVVGPKNRNTDATLAALLMAKRGDGKKRRPN